MMLVMSTQPVASWVPSDAEFGARLALVRQKFAWNIKEAALACNLSSTSWREWELVGRAPRNLVEVVERIVLRTGVDEYWLLTGKKNPRQGGPDGGGVLPRLDSNQQPSGYPSVQVAGVTHLDDRRGERLRRAASAEPMQAPDVAA